MLVEFHIGRGYPSEVDLFVVGTILQLICLKKHLVAAMTLKTYTEAHPSIRRGPPYGHPLLNFVWLLLLAIDTKQSLAVFSILIEKYKRCLDRWVKKFSFTVWQESFGPIGKTSNLFSLFPSSFSPSLIKKVEFQCFFYKGAFIFVRTISTLEKESKACMSRFSLRVDTLKFLTISFDDLRDPNYFQFVDKIGQSFFGLPPPRRNAQPNLFSGLFDQMFSAFNDDDNSDSDESASHSGPSQGARASNTRAAKPGPKARMETEDLD